MGLLQHNAINQYLKVKNKFQAEILPDDDQNQPKENLYEYAGRWLTMPDKFNFMENLL